MVEENERAIIYLQTSKDIYVTGEDLWFKGYVLEDRSLLPSDLDNTLYVELVREEDGQVVSQEMYHIENGFVDGHLLLQDTLPAGDYVLRAYSAHSPDNAHRGGHNLRKLKIIEYVPDMPMVRGPSETDGTGKKDVVHFSMFPEGGHLVSGIPSKVGFKAVDDKGLPRDISGTLYEDGKEVTRFRSMHAGMGSFTMAPVHGRRYHVTLKGLSTPQKFDLPAIMPNGMAMQLLSNSRDTVILKISRSPGTKKRTVYVRFQIRGTVHGLARAPLENEMIIKFPLKDLPQGIAEMTLFDEGLRPVAERLVYVNMDRKLNIGATLDKSGYLTREKVRLRLRTTDGDGRPVAAHLGLSVYDGVYGDPRDPKTIEGHCHLSTQLKGRIYDPGYYFDGKNRNAKQALDYLLITQGWRRYVWNGQGLSTERDTDISGVKDNVQGRLKYVKKGNDMPIQGAVMVYDPLEEDKKKILPLDSLGRFFLTADGLRMGRRLFIRHFGPDRKRVRVDLEDPFGPIEKVRGTRPDTYPLARIKGKGEDQGPPRDLWKSMRGDIVLDAVEVKGKKRNVQRDRYMGRLDSLARLELTTDYVCEESDILNCPVHPKSAKSKRPVEGEIYLELMVWRDGRWVKGVAPRSDEAFINPPLPPYKYPELTDAYLMERFNLRMLKGYYGKREFYCPVHDGADLEGPSPDHRNTLFWKPDIITDGQGEAIIEFHCSDSDAGFIGKIEGVSGTGLIGGQSFEFTVSKRE